APKQGTRRAPADAYVLVEFLGVAGWLHFRCQAPHPGSPIPTLRIISADLWTRLADSLESLHPDEHQQPESP
ncbi:MAG: hypothetical protein KAW67_04120, partial [Candidatus Eisenbacteria sp.]|nr:hypothetical protein [Candidatus Eisenbacteria bacterium]